MLFRYTPTNPDSTLPATSSNHSHHPHHYPPPLITPGPDTRQLATVPAPQNLPKLCKLANCKPADPALPVPSQRHHKKALTPELSLPLPPVYPSVSRMALHGMLLPFGTVSSKLSFQRQSSPGLLTLIQFTFSISTLCFRTVRNKGFLTSHDSHFPWALCLLKGVTCGINGAFIGSTR